MIDHTQKYPKTCKQKIVTEIPVELTANEEIDTKCSMEFLFYDFLPRWKEDKIITVLKSLRLIKRIDMYICTNIISFENILCYGYEFSLVKV